MFTRYVWFLTVFLYSSLAFVGAKCRLLIYQCRGLARTLGKSALGRPITNSRRAFEPLRKQALPVLGARFATTDSAKNGKIHQVIGAVVDGMETFDLPQLSYIRAARSYWRHRCLNISRLTVTAVKFETDQLPAILNALETDNGGNKLILEVSVRATKLDIVASIKL